MKGLRGLTPRQYFWNVFGLTAGTVGIRLFIAWADALPGAPHEFYNLCKMLTWGLIAMILFAM